MHLHFNQLLLEDEWDQSTRQRPDQRRTGKPLFKKCGKSPGRDFFNYTSSWLKWDFLWVWTSYHWDFLGSSFCGHEILVSTGPFPLLTTIIPHLVATWWLYCRSPSLEKTRARPKSAIFKCPVELISKLAGFKSCECETINKQRNCKLSTQKVTRLTIIMKNV